MTRGRIEDRKEIHNTVKGMKWSREPWAWEGMRYQAGGQIILMIYGETRFGRRKRLTRMKRTCFIFLSVVTVVLSLDFPDACFTTLRELVNGIRNEKNGELSGRNGIQEKQNPKHGCDGKKSSVREYRAKNLLTWVGENKLCLFSLTCCFLRPISSS